VTANDEQGPARPRPAHGQLSYLQIPAIDVAQSAAFYEKIFGWHIERPHPGTTHRTSSPPQGPGPRGALRAGYAHNTPH
jgi:predicted enzyme related to lactoylglutathione lyase